jgi:signal transduction histidine kinase
MKPRSSAFQNLPISRKLILAGVVPTVLVLVLAGALFYLYESASIKKSMPRDLTSMANFLALASRASLTFDDPVSASDLLAGLQSNPRIVCAAIYSDKGELFSSYSRTNSPFVPPDKTPPLGAEISERQVEVVTPIPLGNKTIGTIYLVSDLLAFQQRSRIYATGIVISVTLFSIISLALAFQMQRSISRPLNRLAETARHISEYRDYKVRAASESGPEMQLLTSAFNQMLGQIQEQDASLRARTSQLETTKKELEAFTYTVSHDLRAPLRAMSSYSHLLRKSFSADLPAEGLDYLQRVQNNAQKMAELIDELLAFSRLDAEPLHKTEVDLEQVFGSAAEELAASNKIGAAQVLIEPLPKVQADPILIQQVAANLLSNACKYSRNESAPKVIVSSMKKGEKDVIFVMDNGVGFDMQYANKLFGVFQRLHSAREFEGTGVGLAIVQRIIKRHGGEIWAESAVGKGATFYFHL